MVLGQGRLSKCNTPMPTKTKPVAALERQPLEIQAAWADTLYVAIKVEATRDGVWAQCRADMKKDGFNDAMLRYGIVMWGCIFDGLSPVVKRLPPDRVEWALDRKIDHDERTRRFVYLFFRFWFTCWWYYASRETNDRINARHLVDRVDIFIGARKYSDLEVFSEFLRLTKLRSKSTAQGEQRYGRRTKFHLLIFWVTHGLWAMTHADRADFINQRMHTVKGKRISGYIERGAVRTAVERLGL